jgi:hypothetical protein
VASDIVGLKVRDLRVAEEQAELVAEVALPDAQFLRHESGNTLSIAHVLVRTAVRNSVVVPLHQDGMPRKSFQALPSQTLYVMSSLAIASHASFSP